MRAPRLTVLREGVTPMGIRTEREMDGREEMSGPCRQAGQKDDLITSLPNTVQFTENVFNGLNVD